MYATGILAWCVIAVALLALLAMLYAAFIERHWIDFAAVDIELNRLPRAFSGFKIALLTDVHLGFFDSKAKLANAVAKINDQKPDLIVFAGDLLNSSTSLHALPAAIPLLTELTAPLGKMAILGNHDYKAGAPHVRSGLEQSGFRVLKNEHVLLQKDGAELYVIGLDDVLKGRPDLETATQGIPPTACGLLLVHEPDYADRIPPSRIDLQLSGHSHGGQVCFPFVGPMVTTRLGKKYHTGLHYLENLKLYTSRGFGTTGVPFRFFCRPEVTLLTLQAVETKS